MKMTDYQKKLVEENMELIDQVIRSRIGILNGPMTSYDDLYQTGGEALCKAAIRYVPGRGSFPAFARKVIYHSMINYCRSMNYRSRNQSEIFFDCDSSDLAMLLVSRESETALREVEHADTVRLFHQMKRGFSGIARKGVEAMELKMDGYTPAEITEMYGTTWNNITAWISRARKKLKGNRTLMNALGVTESASVSD